jgi:hypothetical protein
MKDYQSLELPYDHLKSTFAAFNLEVIEDDLDVPCSYTQNPESLMRHTYHAIRFVCRKMPATNDNVDDEMSGESAPKKARI